MKVGIIMDQVITCVFMVVEEEPPELPGKGGLAMLRFNEDQAITGHSYSVNLFLN